MCSCLDTDEANKLAAFAVVLGIMYAVVTGIESFGVLTALSVRCTQPTRMRRRLTCVRALQQRLWMARTYAFLSVGSALVVIAAAFMRVITHFILKVGIRVHLYPRMRTAHNCVE